MLRSLADLGNEDAAVLNNVFPPYVEAPVAGELDDKEDDVEGWLMVLLVVGCSGVKCRRPSSILVIVLSTFLVTSKNKNMF